MPTEPSETAEHTGSTGVRAVYRAPLTAGVSVLMDHNMHNDPPFVAVHRNTPHVKTHAGSFFCSSSELLLVVGLYLPFKAQTGDQHLLWRWAGISDRC